MNSAIIAKQLEFGKKNMSRPTRNALRVRQL